MFSFRNAIYKIQMSLALAALAAACSTEKSDEPKAPEVESSVESSALSSADVEQQKDNQDQEIEDILNPEAVTSDETPAEELKKQLQDEPVEIFEVEDPVDPASLGLIRFFEGANRGVVVKGIRWSSELARDNPGVDCKLKKRGAGLYNCVVSQSNQASVLTVREEKVPQRPTARRLSRITFDGKGLQNKNRISTELKNQGYRSLGTLRKNGIDIESFQENDAPRTRADLLWVPTKLSFTLILRPGLNVSKKAKPKVPKQQAAGKKTKAKKAKNSKSRP